VSDEARLEDRIDAHVCENRLVITLQQGWVNSGPLRVFLWPAKTVGKIRLAPTFPSRARSKSFSCMKINKSKYRCSLTDINLQAVMRISTSNLTSDLKSVIRYICLIKLILKLNVLAAIDEMKLAQ
jgi:hypothetical protein